MRQLLDDFLRQSWAMKLFVLWGWLAVVIMIASFATTATGAICSPSDEPREQRDQGMVCRLLAG